jgi:hypothetical protein
MPPRDLMPIYDRMFYDKHEMLLCKIRSPGTEDRLQDKRDRLQNRGNRLYGRRDRLQEK